jgi:hypothetical protein
MKLQIAPQLVTPPVSPVAVIVKAVLVNALPANVPEPNPLWMKVMGAAMALMQPSNVKPASQRVALLNTSILCTSCDQWLSKPSQASSAPVASQRIDFIGTQCVEL